MSKSSYPIVKYPENIQRKLKERKPNSGQKKIVVDTPDLFPVLFPQTSIIIPPPYHDYLLWAILGSWLFILPAIAFKAVSGGVLVGLVALTGAGLTWAWQQGQKYQRLVKKKDSRLKDRAQSATQPTVTAASNDEIDWSDNVRELVRSRKKSTAQVGVSEERFLGQLQSALPGQITFGNTYLPQGYSHPYSADIELILSNGLGIQIEIDEPYVGKTGEPHHCWDVTKDETRDAYFLGIGWVIIRFSERQVVTDPQGCCVEIAKLVANLTQDPRMIELSKSSKKLKSEPQWSEAESRVMAKMKLRQKYLKEAGLWKS